MQLQSLQTKLVLTTTLRAWTLDISVYPVCAFFGVRVCRCVRVYVPVCWNPTFHLFDFVAMLPSAADMLLLLPYHVICMATCLKLSSFLLCVSHGTTPVARKYIVKRSPEQNWRFALHRRWYFFFCFGVLEQDRLRFAFSVRIPYDHLYRQFCVYPLRKPRSRL